MSDRELLELAAKAAGIEHVTPMMIEWGQWNPLTDDGDALRLAVKLGLHMTNGETHAWASHLAVEATEPFHDDPYAATRRAFVRAAAEIGMGLRPFPTAEEIREDWT